MTEVILSQVAIVSFFLIRNKLCGGRKYKQGTFPAFLQPATLQRVVLSQTSTISQLQWASEGNIREQNVVAGG